MRPLKTLQRLYDEESHILLTEKGSPPRVLFSGENLLVEELPVGTRVIFPRPPLLPLPNVKAAIRWALNHPEGKEPLHALLRPGMKVTVALDDIALPLAPLGSADIRQTVLEIVLQLLADSGVDDVQLLIANGLNRRMTESEMRRAVGSEIFNAFYPDRYKNHDAEDPDNLVALTTQQPETPARINRRAAESDLIIHVGVNLLPAGAGPSSIGFGLTDYDSLRPPPPKKAVREADAATERLHNPYRNAGAIERLIDAHLNVFHIEAVLNNRMFGEPATFLGKREEDYTEVDRLKLSGMKFALSKMPRPLKRKLLSNIPSACGVIGVVAGASGPCREKKLELSARQHSVPVNGPSDVVILGIPFSSPYSAGSIVNPVILQSMGLGFLFNLHSNAPLVKKGGVLILCHPAYDEFDPEQHSSHIEFFNRLLAETKDAAQLEQKYEREFALNPSYVHLYRKGNAYHGSHPFFLWSASEAGRRHVGKVIVAGSENNHVPSLFGWDRTDTLAEAIEAAKGFAGREATVTLVRTPPFLQTDVKV